MSDRMEDGRPLGEDDGVIAGPELTVVITVFAGRPYLVRCLDALLQGNGADRLEIVVPVDESVPAASELAARYPTVRFIPRPGVRTPAELRATGIAAGTAPLVAVTEDHCIPTPDWAEQVIAEHEEPYAAIGGVLEKVEAPDGRDSGYSWALYLSDWGRYMPPVAEGPVEYLTDCNVSYKRSALEALRPTWEDEFHETTVNWALRDRGEVLWLSPRVIVRQQRSLSLRDAVRDRFGFGRLFAYTRVSATGTWQRFVYAGGSVLLPAILIARVLTTVWRKRRARSAFLRALPALVVTTTVWAAGEFTGYVTGTAPASLAPDGSGARLHREELEP